MKLIVDRLSFGYSIPIGLWLRFAKWSRYDSH